MKPSEIELHIEELILDGFAPAERYQVADAIERELTRLVTLGGLAPSDAAHIDAGSVQLKPNATPRATGKQIARTVYGGLTS